MSEGDKNGIRQIRERVIDTRKKLSDGTADEAEIAEWLTVWLQTPDAFETWVSLRKRSADFKKRFGDAEPCDAEARTK